MPYDATPARYYRKTASYGMTGSGHVVTVIRLSDMSEVQVNERRDVIDFGHLIEAETDADFDLACSELAFPEVEDVYSYGMYPEERFSPVWSI